MFRRRRRYRNRSEQDHGGQGRYPHPDKESPPACIVWHDIPDAGTQTTPDDSAYFNAQDLFIFDLTIIVVSNKLAKQHLDILNNCKIDNIPSLVVRSKTGMHIGNAMTDKGCSYDDARGGYIDEAHKKFKEDLEKA